MKDIVDRITEWLENDDIAHPVQALHDARAEIIGLRARLDEHRLAIHRLAGQDVTPNNAMLRERCNAKTPNDATPMAGSGPTVPANDRASDCSEDGRVRASASSIGNTHEPVAWAVVSDSTEQIDCEFVYPDEATAGDVALESNGGVVPLYRKPPVAENATSATLTDAEREAVEAAARIIDAYEDEMDGFPSGAAATLRGLLERMRGGK